MRPVRTNFQEIAEISGFSHCLAHLVRLLCLEESLYVAELWAATSRVASSIRAQDNDLVLFRVNLCL